jgi:hypothetical protein
LKFVLAHCGGGGILLGDAIVAAVFCPNIYGSPQDFVKTLKYR